jgi:hypothetical protein
MIIFNVTYTAYIIKKRRAALNFVLQYLISPDVRDLRILSFPSQEICLNIFPQFKTLLSLVMYHTEIVDGCLDLIGIYCENLRYVYIELMNAIFSRQRFSFKMYNFLSRNLDLRDCRNITDTGIQLLCFSNNGNGAENQRLSNLCKTLQYLLIQNTSVTEKGLQMAIANLTVLKHLDHLGLFDVMLALTMSRLESKVTKYPYFPFVHLTINTIIPYKGGSLGKVIQVCPSLTSVHTVFIDGLTNADLSSLMSLKYLTKWFLTAKFDSKKCITFKDGVVPLLTKFGHSLIYLAISCCGSVDIWTILRLCPYLTFLRIPIRFDKETVLSTSE